MRLISILVTFSLLLMGCRGQVRERAISDGSASSTASTASTVARPTASAQSGQHDFIFVREVSQPGFGGWAYHKSRYTGGCYAISPYDDGGIAKVEDQLCR